MLLPLISYVDEFEKIIQNAKKQEKHRGVRAFPVLYVNKEFFQIHNTA